MRVILLTLACFGFALCGCTSKFAASESRNHLNDHVTPHALVLSPKPTDSLGEAGLNSLNPEDDSNKHKLIVYRPFLEAAFSGSKRSSLRCYYEDESPLRSGFNSCIYRCRGQTISLVKSSAKLCPKSYEFSDIAQGMYNFHVGRLNIVHASENVVNSPQE
jgi:hypothetical protein